MPRSFSDAWPTIVSRLQQRFGLARTHRWLPYLGLLEVDDLLTLQAPTPRAASTTRKHLRDIQQMLTDVLDLQTTPSIKVVVGSSEATKELAGPRASGKTARRSRSHQRPSSKVRQSIDTVTLNPKHSLNRFAHCGNEVGASFAANIASQPGLDYNPFIIHGPPGVGKTHLIQGLTLRFRELFPKKNWAFVSTESLSRYFGLSTHNNNLDQFRNRYRNLDLLVLDDLQVISTKNAFQTELMRILDGMLARGGQLVFSSNSSPREIGGLHDALRSRLMAGVIVELKLPDYEQRYEILERQQRQLGCEFSPEVLSFLASKIPSNTGDLVGAFTKLGAYARLIDREVDLASAKNALNEMLGSSEETASPENIARYVGNALGVSTEAILGGNRKPAVAKARQLAMSLTRHFTDLTLLEIGTAFGRSTGAVHFALQRMRDQVQSDQTLKGAALAVAGHFISGEAFLDEL
ncbi:MAG: DnaA/Hda family protein [Planctomycetota bacterium]|nr:DnaA/Hda family protein [Planctomycetota bacterium]